MSDFTEAFLERLVTNGVSESRNREFKRDDYGNNDDARIEFLKDVSGLANADGGQLIIGMEEQDGVASRVCGVELQNIDSRIQAIEASFRDNIEPRLPSVSIHPVRLASGRHCIVVDVAKSWVKPHRVSFKKVRRFYLRRDRSVDEASVEELRRMFLHERDVADTVRNIQQERVRIIREEYSLGTEGRPSLICHLMPLVGLDMEFNIDLGKLDSTGTDFMPLFGGGLCFDYNLDGLMVTSYRDPGTGYVQIFRSGIVEAVAPILSSGAESRTVPVQAIQDELLVRIPRFLNGLNTLRVAPPIALTIMMSGIVGTTFIGPRHLDFLVKRQTVERDLVKLPTVMIDQYSSGTAYDDVFRQPLDALWNCAGIAKAHIPQFKG